MEHRAIVETVFKTVVASLPTELGALLGQELACSEPSFDLITKDSFFGGEPRPKSTLAHLKVSGDAEGESFLILPVKTSIIFGGTLIMLPQEQIDENTSQEKLDGEVADAYGEVANILAGVMTQVFLEKYPQNLRYVRTEVEEFIDTKVEVASDQPFPARSYFYMTTGLKMGALDLGKLEILVPNEILGLEMAETATPQTETEAVPQAADETKTASPSPAPETTPPPPARKPFADAKKIADVVLKSTLEQIAEEVGALLGQTYKCSDLKLEMVSKNDFFSTHCLEKSILTRMDLADESQRQIYLINQIKDATLMGGTLIMLPEDEIQDLIGKGVFDGEVADAYGEVANIISGGLTQSFQERYPTPLRFIKTTAETIVPTKIDPAADQPFSEGLYYMASCATSLQDTNLGRLFLLFPADVLGLEGYQKESAPPDTPAQTTSSTQVQSTGSSPEAVPTETVRPGPQMPPGDATPVVLVVTDAEEDAEAIRRNLANDQYDIQVIGFKDDIRAIFSTHPVLGIFLLMSEVGEKGFSVAIKLQSSGYPLPPLIAGGPEWTRSTVLKAIKYGARDILVTPATDDEIREKANQHINAMA